MGISFFESFLKFHARRILRPVDLRQQYIVLDGSEVLYMLYFDCDARGRGNYVTFQTTIQQFFNNLKECGITPIVLFDGFLSSSFRKLVFPVVFEGTLVLDKANFKLEDNVERYVKRREQKIRVMTNMFEGSFDNHARVKPSLCELVFAQVLGDIGVISVTGVGDMDKTIAVVAKLLEAPVVASDTVFCTFALEHGMVPLHTLDWKRVRKNEEGEPYIRGSAFYQRQLADRYNVDVNAIPFLLVFFPNVSWIDKNTFENFCRENFESVEVDEDPRRHWKIKLIEKCLVWLSQNYVDGEDEALINRMVSSLPDDRQDQLTGVIFSYLESRKEPKGQAKVLDVICGRIDDPLLSARLEDEEIRSEEHHEEIVAENNLEELVDDASSLSFPAWAIRMIIAHSAGNAATNYLPLALTDTRVYPSPHAAAEGIRLRSYKVLVTNTDLEFIEYDRVEHRYIETKRHRVDEYDLELGPRGRAFERVDEEATMELRRAYVLDTLVSPENTETRERFDSEFDSLSDHLKLPVAVALYWIAQSQPDVAAIEALAFQMTMCLGLRSIRQLHGILHEMRRNLNLPERGDWCEDTQALHWSSEWQLCLWEAISLNQILGFPLPEPDVAKVSESILFERACMCFLAGHTAEDYVRRHEDRLLLRRISALLRGIE